MIILAKSIMLIMDLIVILKEWFIFRNVSDAISTTLEAQSILSEKDLAIVRPVYLGMERKKGVYRVSIYIRTL